MASEPADARDNVDFQNTIASEAHFIWLILFVETLKANFIIGLHDLCIYRGIDTHNAHYGD
jgi:hypothetical protein